MVVAHDGVEVLPDHLQILFNADGSTDLLLLFSHEGQYQIDVRCDDRALVGVSGVAAA